MKERTDLLTGRVRRYMEKENMAERGSRILLGISGGADSVCMLHIMNRLSKDMDWELTVVHVNHLIREEAGEDAEFVRNLCDSLGIPFFLREADVESLAKQQGISAEEAGRNIRYQTFEDVSCRVGADRIAVAHNRNDRAETFLFHLFRGTGLAGMASIRPRRGKIIRPLLDVGRDEIENWLKAENIPWCCDRTNDTDDYTRNRIRRHILPYAKKEICAEADVHLAAEAELLAGTADLILELAEEGIARCCQMTELEEAVIDIKMFAEEKCLIQTHILYLILKRLSNGGRDIGMSHVEQIHGLFTAQSGRRVSLPGQLEALRDFGEVRIRRRAVQGGPVDERKDGQTAGIGNPGQDLKKILERDRYFEAEIPGLGKVEYSLKKREKSLLIEEKTYTKWLDYDKIESLVLRSRQQGDYLTVNDRLQRKSLKEYMIQEKIPAEKRAEQMLFADGSHIVWVVGHRISSAVKITDSTEYVLRIDIRGGEEDG